MKGKYDIGFRIKKISDLMEQKANAALKSYDLTFSQMRILHYLYHQPEHMAKLKEIERTFRVSQPTVAGIAVRLEEKGFVVSRSEPSDRRVKILQLTGNGEKVCTQTMKTAMQMQEEVDQAMGEEKMEQLSRLLDELYESTAATMKEEGKQ